MALTSGSYYYYAFYLAYEIGNGKLGQGFAWRADHSRPETVAIGHLRLRCTPTLLTHILKIRAAVALNGDMTSESLLYRVDAGIATITFNRPKSLNALTNEMKAAFLDALNTAAGDEAVRVVVLTGAERAFCVGQDLREHLDEHAKDPSERVNTVKTHYNPIALAIHSMPKPVVARVNGVAAGAGLSLAMLADIRLATASAKFTTSFAGIALSCDTGSSWTLQRLVGAGRAMDLLLDPRVIDADEAAKIGLVTDVYSDEEFDARAQERIRALAEGPTLAYASIRESVSYAANHTLEESLAFEEPKMALTGDSQDHDVAVEAFLAKKKPTFTGK